MENGSLTEARKLMRHWDHEKLLQAALLAKRTKRKGKMKTPEQYYAFYLDDPATPAFCSIPKLYVGSKSDLLRVADNLIQDDVYPETSAGIREYFDGKVGCTHIIAYQEMPILRPVRVLEASELLVYEREWTHLNTWNCPYHMKFQSASVSQILILKDELFYRCIRARFQELSYESICGGWKQIGDSIFGHACVIDVCSVPEDDFTFRSILYVVEDSAKTPEILLSRMNDPKYLVFDRICDEVFGDG